MRPFIPAVSQLHTYQPLLSISRNGIPHPRCVFRCAVEVWHLPLHSLSFTCWYLQATGWSPPGWKTRAVLPSTEILRMLCYSMWCKSCRPGLKRGEERGVAGVLVKRHDGQWEAKLRYAREVKVTSVRVRNCKSIESKFLMLCYLHSKRAR